MKVDVVVAEDHRLARESVIRLLKWTPGVEVVGKADSGGQALGLIRALKPDVLLLDLTTEDVDGLAVLAELRTEEPELPVIVVSTREDPITIAKAMAAGATGYLYKRSLPLELPMAVQAVASGGSYLCGAARARLVS